MERGVKQRGEKREKEGEEYVGSLEIAIEYGIDGEVPPGPPLDHQ